MARDVARRLAQLQKRRSGTDRLFAMDSAYADAVIAKSLLQEAWQKRVLKGAYTRYALGAMQEVDADYTKVSLETAERVGKSLSAGFSALGTPIEFRLQGSVALNVHVRGMSDVDLLNLHGTYLTYHKFGPKANTYGGSTGKSSLEVLKDLRIQCESILKKSFPAAHVDCSGGKAIKISKGSLQRPVDVVPSHWFDTRDYQEHGLEFYRGVTILDKKANTTCDNFPFKHIGLINYQDSQASGGLKKAIRLAKNVKYELDEEGGVVDFPSFDIAATMYHADIASLKLGATYELAILAETQRFLSYLAANESAAKALMVPDGSRLIFDRQSKLEGLSQLAVEMEDLAKEVAREQKPLLGANPALHLAREELNKSVL